MKIGYVAFHGDDETSLPYRGKIVEVRTLWESKTIVLVETTDANKIKFWVGKWPLQLWGKDRGIVSSRAKAQTILDAPKLVMDSDGNKINKISKSQLT